MKPSVRVIEPRYVFIAEHQASSSFQYRDQVITANPVDISKNHISFTLPNSTDNPLIGDPIDGLSLSFGGDTFQPLNTVVTKIQRDKGDLIKMVVQCNDKETSMQFWKITYLLRTFKGADSIVDYDVTELPRIPKRGSYTEEARQERLAFVREQTGASIEGLANTSFDPKALASNIEAFIGSIEVPVGIAGPLYIRGANANGLYLAPMATSEGALVASVTRGATAISKSGGVTARVLGQRMMRVPVFVLSDLDSAFFFSEWVKDHFEEIKAETKKYSNYADLTELETHLLGKSVGVQFVYETGDAAGQNMTTTCTWQACQWIMRQMQAFEGIRFDRFLIESNLSADKKVTYQTYLKGRGVRVIAEAVVTEEVCRRILKSTPEKLMRGYLNAVSGSVAAGMVGTNINIANVIGAMFAATGQDIACVHESAIGHLHMELTDDNSLYMTMMLPSLVVGTVGGGTNLPHQKECLQIMDCAGAGNAHKLAEIIASYCLALDLSTMSAVVSDHFAHAHEALGRNRPVEWLKLGDFNKAFFTRAMQSYLDNQSVQVTAVESLNVSVPGSSILTELKAHKANKLLGHFPFAIQLEGDEQAMEMMLKVKPLDEEVFLVANAIASSCDPRLAETYKRFHHTTEFKHSQVRELEVMANRDPRFIKYLPTVYYGWQDAKREAYVLVEERLKDVELMDTLDDTSGWTPEHVEVALKGIAEIHSIWYGNVQELLTKPSFSNSPNQMAMMERMRLWELLGVHALEAFPEWFSEGDMEHFREAIYSMPDWYAEIDRMPKTLIHNDFNPSNICFRKTSTGPLLCTYDWELATVNIPQHDLAELLTMTLSPDVTNDDVTRYVECHRMALEHHMGNSIDPAQWRRGYQLSLLDLLANRIPTHVMNHTFRHYKFMERVLATFRRLLEIEHKYS